jgi:hypothetical protein
MERRYRNDGVERAWFERMIEYVAAHVLDVRFTGVFDRQTNAGLVKVDADYMLCLRCELAGEFTVAAPDIKDPSGGVRDGAEELTGGSECCGSTAWHQGRQLTTCRVLEGASLVSLVEAFAG